MANRKIDDQIRDYFAAQRPSPDAMERLKLTIRAGAPVPQPRRMWIGAAAIIVVAVLSLVWTAGRRVAPSPQQFAVALAHQAALGHNEKQEMEFRVRDYAALQRQMKSLDFTPVEPVMMKEMNMRVVGARYTTIGGEMAAQIFYVDRKGVSCTLYEVRPVNQLARVPAGEQEVDGLQVAIWREKGLVMVLAEPLA